MGAGPLFTSDENGICLPPQRPSGGAEHDGSCAIHDRPYGARARFEHGERMGFPLPPSPERGELRWKREIVDTPGFSTGGSARATITTSVACVAATAAATSASVVSVAPAEYDTRSALNWRAQRGEQVRTDFGYMVSIGALPCVGPAAVPLAPAVRSAPDEDFTQRQRQRCALVLHEASVSFRLRDCSERRGARVREGVLHPVPGDRTGRYRPSNREDAADGRTDARLVMSPEARGDLRHR
jgi:hypothetical protein